MDSGAPANDRMTRACFTSRQKSHLASMRLLDMLVFYRINLEFMRLAIWRATTKALSSATLRRRGPCAWAAGRAPRDASRAR